MNAPQALPLTPTLVAVVFGLAVVAYLLLTAITVGAAQGERAPAVLRSRPGALAGAALVAMTVHVLLIWSLRFDFDVAIATRNGWGGFITFHAALIGSWAAMTGDWRAARWRRLTLLGVWLLVTSGAVGAPFRYPEVSSLAVPVIGIAVLGAVGLGAALLTRRRASD